MWLVRLSLGALDFPLIFWLENSTEICTFRNVADITIIY